MKIILAQYFEIFQIASSGKIYNKNIMKLQEFEIPFTVFHLFLDFSFLDQNPLPKRSFYFWNFKLYSWHEIDSPCS